MQVAVLLRARACQLAPGGFLIREKGSNRARVHRVAHTRGSWLHLARVLLYFFPLLSLSSIANLLPNLGFRFSLDNKGLLPPKKGNCRDTPSARCFFVRLFDFLCFFFCTDFFFSSSFTFLFSSCLFYFMRPHSIRF